MRRILVTFFLAAALLAGASTLRLPVELSAAAQQSQGNPYAIVWVDPQYSIYHCPGSRFYGITRGGYKIHQYQALQRRLKPAYGWVCK